ncbi:MAG: autorepressor SdpR family transcription factor [Oscillospiraceae bacterium]|nr:autorepressor SdpR family transcription factor [Oscillospiraceae bacterium]
MKDVWNALADPTRREILTLLQKKDLTAGEICANFSVSGATISHHLKILRETDLILAHKEKQTITYRLNTTVFQDFLKTIAQIFGQSQEEENYETE